MNIGNRIFGMTGRFEPDSDRFTLLPATLVTNLLLFESFVMLSALLNEFPQIIDLFGFPATLELLNSGAIEIHCEPTQIVNWGSTEEAMKNGTLFSYEPQVIVSHDHKEYVHSCTEDVRKLSRLPVNDFIKLRAALVTNIDKRVRESRTERPEFKAARSLVTDLESNAPSLKRSVINQLHLRGKNGVLPTDFKLKMHRRDGDKFDAETDIRAVLGLDDATAHDVIQQGILNLGGMKATLFYMSHYSAMSSLNLAEAGVLSDELQQIAESLSAEKKIQQFNRVREIKGFPDLQSLPSTGQLSLEKILELRATPEIKEFRAWLLEIDRATESEIAEQIESFSAHVGSFLPIKHNKTIRLVVTNGLGAIPVVGPIDAAGDSFVLEQVLPKSGPISFINNRLPSLFVPARGTGN